MTVRKCNNDLKDFISFIGIDLGTFTDDQHDFHKFGFLKLQKL